MIVCILLLLIAILLLLYPLLPWLKGRRKLEALAGDEKH